MKSYSFYKELTPAEVGDTGTHEIYIRFPNNFDYEKFFHGTATVNNTVIDVVFEAKDLPQEIKNIVSEGFILRYKNGEYTIDEGLTEKNFEGVSSVLPCDLVILDENYKEIKASPAGLPLAIEFPITILAKRNSYAHRFATENGIAYEEWK